MDQEQGIGRGAPAHGQRPVAAVPDKGTTSTQLGKAIEALVASTLMLASKGRLSPFLPFADDDGLDLLLLDKVTGATIPVQIKGRTGKHVVRRGTVQFDIRRKTLSFRPGAVLLAVLVDLDLVSIGQSWLVPLAELERVSMARRDVLTITPNRHQNSADRYRRFRSETVAELVSRILATLDRGKTSTTTL